jgi:hypothetical protein
MYLKSLAGIVVLATFLSVASADITINGYTPQANDRFTNSNQFIAGKYNLSGVGQTNDGRWGTLISSNVIVSANHLAPSGNISFYADNNPANTPVTRQILNSVRIGTSDLWVARLSSAVDSSINSYQFATQHIAGGNQAVGDAGIYQNANSLMTGRSPESHPAFQDQAVGQNLISGLAANVEFLDGHTDALVTWFDPAKTPGWVTYESHLAGGDSGAPFFVQSGNELLLAGINSFVIMDSGVIYGSGATYLGNYADQIQQFVAVSAVPEPTSLALLAISAGTWGWCKRRRKITA